MLLNYFLATIILSLLGFFIRQKTVMHSVVLIHALLTLALAADSYNHLGETQLDFFRPDHLSVLFLVLVGFVGFMAAVHYISYSQKGEVPTRNIALHNASIIVFTAALTGVLMTNHFGVLWAFMEVTTLSAAILIQHDRNMESAEATWKYLFIVSIGIALAFVGVMFLGFAIQDTGNLELSFENVRNQSDVLNTTWIKASFLLVLTGFSVKMGLAPLFNADIDAKDASPSPVSALFATIMVNSGFVAIFRFYCAFAQTPILPWMNKLLFITGVISLFFAAVYMLRVRNIKRLLAYSGMEHSSLAILAIASGGIGYFAALLHLILHTLIKSTIFFQVGQMHNIFGSKQDYDIRGYMHINPIGAMVILLGIFSALAFPPSGMFISEFMIFHSLYAAGSLWTLGFTFLFLLIIIYGLVSRILPMIFSHVESNDINLTSIRKWESVLQLCTILLVFYLGLVRPPFLVEFITNAIKVLP